MKAQATATQTISLPQWRRWRWPRKVVRMLWNVVLAVMILVAALGGLLWALSPGKARPYLDKHGAPLAGSLSEKVFVEINGTRQGMFIKSKAAGLPVLLYLHGGIPDIFLTARYPSSMEDLFTVVWWEMRGSGLSYSAGIPEGANITEQLIDDTLAMTDYLRERFGVEKITLMGHSGGSFIAIQAAARAPERYHAYIGEAQMVYQIESERRAYEYMLEQFEADGSTAWLRRLQAAPVTIEGGTPPGYLAMRDAAMHRLGIGTTHDMTSIVSGLLLPSLTYREYTLAEKASLWLGKARAGVSLVWDDMLATDLRAAVPRLEIPVYFVEGAHDYTVNSALAREYFDLLDAPVKGFYTFNDSAHTPALEEPQRFLLILREDVLRGTNTLTDRKQ